MNEERDRKRHRLAWSSAIALLVVAFGAPLAGAAGVEVPQVTEVPLPVDEPSLPGAPEVPEVPEVPLPGVEAPLPLPDVTTDPVPLDEPTDVVDDVAGGAGDAVEDVVDGVTDPEGPGGGVIEDVTDGPVGDVVDDVTDPDGPVGGVIDDVTDPDGPVGGVIDDVTDPDGPVGEVVDDVTDPDGPVGGVIDDVTDPDGPVGGIVDEVGNNAGPVVESVVKPIADAVDGVVDDVVGALPAAPDTPGLDEPATGGLDPAIDDPTNTGGNDTSAPAGDAAALFERIAATIPLDGFAANLLGASETAAAFVPPARDVSEPSLVERIARSVSELAQKIAFPLLLALVVGAFVVVQNRMDRRDPKLALAAVDADEDLLGFE